MSTVIAVRGVESEKIVNGRRTKTVPFVGADREGEFASLGVGLIYPEEGKAVVWGLVMPHALIQSWRGMKILEQVGAVEHGTLCACWTIARRDMHDSDKHYIEDLAPQFGGIKKLNAVREHVLDLVPTAEELSAMITALREKNVNVDHWDLDAEVKAGRISSFPLIDTIGREEEEQRQAYQRKEEEIKKPLPREESLGAFFEDLNIANFIIGPAIGGYGMDWGHIKLEELDAIAKRDSFSEYITDGYHLEHTTEGPETLAADIAPGVRMYQTSFGEIENPWFIGADGTRFTFLFAKYRDGHFYLKTKVERGEAGSESEHTIAELREMIGPLPPKPAARQGFLGRVAAMFR